MAQIKHHPASHTAHKKTNKNLGRAFKALGVQDTILQELENASMARHVIFIFGLILFFSISFISKMEREQ